MGVAIASSSSFAVSLTSNTKSFERPTSETLAFIAGFGTKHPLTLHQGRCNKAGLHPDHFSRSPDYIICSSPWLSLSRKIVVVQASPAAALEDGSDTDAVPTPKVIIDQDSDPNATIVEITFGDRLGALLDTMNALKNLGLNVVKANVFLDSSGKHNSFSITRADTGRKVEEPEMLEAIRLTIINNLLEYHPESSSQLAMGLAFGVEPPKQQVDVDIATRISIVDDGPDRSLLHVETADRPGLLVDLVKIITDINVAVESGEFDTEGLLAKAKFHVNYRGKALIKPLQMVVANSLRYFLRRPSTEEASF